MQKLTEAEKEEINRRCDFIMEQEVLNECAAGISSDYKRYCKEHGIDVFSEHPIAKKTRLVWDYKGKIIGNPDCRTAESLIPIKEELKKLKRELMELMEKEKEGKKN